MSRDTTISICKGIAIILMVIAHAEAPGALCKFIFEFHMPLFFITAGFFFSLKYLNDETAFIKKRIKGLYLPFVKWSVFFLIIHNWMFDIGILNEKFGNEMGGVTHPYTWHQMQQNLWHIPVQAETELLILHILQQPEQISARLFHRLTS